MSKATKPATATNESANATTTTVNAPKQAPTFKPVEFNAEPFTFFNFETDGEYFIGYFLEVIPNTSKLNGVRFKEYETNEQVILPAHVNLVLQMSQIPNAKGKLFRVTRSGHAVNPTNGKTYFTYLIEVAE